MLLSFADVMEVSVYLAISLSGKTGAVFSDRSSTRVSKLPLTLLQCSDAPLSELSPPSSSFCAVSGCFDGSGLLASGTSSF